MRILFAIKNMKDAKGGAEKVLSIVANGLAEKGYEVTLLTFDERGGETFYKVGKNIKRLSLGIGKSGQHAGFKETFARMLAIRKVVQVRQPDIVIPFMHSMFIPVAFSLVGLGVKVIASEHTVPRHYKKKKIEYFLLMLSSFFVTKMTVLSEAVRQLYPRFIRKKMIVIPNPIYLFDDGSGSEDDINHDAKNIILNVGSLLEGKDQKALIRAFALIADKYPNWNMRIVGEGAYREFLEDLITFHSLSERVYLAGVTSNVAKEYKRAHIFATPSRYESFGLAAAEAMSFGVPVIGFETCAGINEIVTNNRNGLLVKRRDKERVQNLADGLEALIKDENLRLKLGGNAKKDIVQYQPNLIVNRWEVLIQGVVRQW